VATRPSLWPPLRRDRLGEPEIYDVLQNERRRRAVRHLCDHAGELTLGELATHLARDESADAAATNERSVYNSLHQTHLPKLESEGVVVYDRETNTVTLEATAGDLERYLGLRSLFGFTWGEYYRTLATASLLVALAVELDLGPLGGIETLPVITVALVLLTVSVLYQVWRRRWIYVRSLLG
jgi:DNA-binding transcriptional ArsR family regulator